MSGSTTELNLRTAVDSDDNADYLTVDLANSLRTMDALFNNVTGHNHGSAHQGGPIVLGTSGIADGSITNAKLGDGSVDSAKILDGSITVADLAPAVYTLGGDLSGTVQAGHVILANGSPIQAKGSDAVVRNLLYVGGDNNTYLYAGSGGSWYLTNASGGVVVSITSAGNLTTPGYVSAHLIVNNNNDIQQVRTYYGMNNSIYLSNDGTTWTLTGPLSVTGNVTISAATLTVNAGGQGNIYVGDAMFQRWNAQQIRFSGCPNGVIFPSSITIEGTQQLQFGTGYYLRGSPTNSQWIETTAYMVAPQFLIAGSSYAYIGQGRSASELNATVHFFVTGSIVAGGSITPGGSSKKTKAIFAMSDDECLQLVADERVQPVRFRRHVQPEPGYNKQPDIEMGFVAEDVADVMPEVVATVTETGEPWGINYQHMVAPLWGAVRALQARIKELEAA